jgi:hypothetical protein
VLCSQYYFHENISTQKFLSTVIKSFTTEMSTRNNKIIMFLGSKEWQVRKADNLTAIYEPIV